MTIKGVVKSGKATVSGNVKAAGIIPEKNTTYGILVVKEKHDIKGVSGNTGILVVKEKHDIKGVSGNTGILVVKEEDK